MCGFIAQLVEHRTGIAEVTGSNPVEALTFFQASSFRLLKLENILRRSFFIFRLGIKIVTILPTVVHRNNKFIFIEKGLRILRRNVFKI